MNLAISLRHEILKTKRTAAFYFALIGASVVPFILLINIISEGLPEKGKSSQDPINFIFHLSSQMTGLVILPFFVILVCTLLPQLEYKNSTWKQVLSSPQTKENVFSAKFLNIHLLILFFLVASHLFIWLVILATHFILPELSVLNQPFNFYKVLADNANSYVAITALTAIQFWIGLRSKNFIVPIAIGLAAWLGGTLMVFEYHSPAALYFPYSFHAISLSEFKDRLLQVEWTSVGYAFVILLLGFWDFKRRRMVG
jgi:hypothetical protein